MAIDSQRAPQVQRGSADDTWLGPVLVARGVLTPRQAERLAVRDGRSLWSAAVADGATDEGIVAAVSRAYGVAPAELAAAEGRTTTLLPESLARRHQVVPHSADDRVIRIATADPRDLDLEQTLRFVTGREVVFQIASLPGDGTTEGAVTPPPGEAAAPGPGRVLIADDDPQMRRLIRGELQRDGFEVVEAGDGLDALEVIEQGGVDLVILDVDMPRLDGLGVLEELRAQVRTACLPVIVLTAQHGETEEKALDLGAHDYLCKPVQTRSLVARVRAVLKRASS